MKITKNKDGSLIIDDECLEVKVEDWNSACNYVKLDGFTVEQISKSMITNFHFKYD